MGYKNLQFDSNSLFLVTGGAGFIGSNLCEAILNMGYRVRCLDNLITGKKENVSTLFNNRNFEFIEGDIKDINVCLKACKDVDYVLHHAALGSVPGSIENPLDYCVTNIQGTVNMLEAARNHKVKKFVYASSASVYGNDSYLPKCEEKIGKQLSPYALTKLNNEGWAKQYAMHYGVDTYGLRYFNVFGKKQDPEGTYAAVIPKFIKALIRNEQPIIYGDGKQTRDFIYIENVIEANLKACLAPREAAGEVYNIAYGEQNSLIEIYNVIAKLLEKDSINPMYCDERKGDIKHSGADITKAKQLLDYHPDYDFNKGINESIEWYKHNLKD